MKRALVLAVLVASSVLVGCQTSYSFPDGPSNEEFKQRERERFSTVRGVPVNGKLEYHGYTAMERMADVVPPNVWACVKSININGDDSHYRADHAAHCHSVSRAVYAQLYRVVHAIREFRWPELLPADVMKFGDGDICVRPQYTKDIVLVHEVAHAYHVRLNASGKKFSKEWLFLAGDVYGADNIQPGEEFPSRGLLREYSAESYWEDVADTFMYVHAEAAFGKDTPYDQLRDRGLLAKDSVYRAKVELLRKYGFLTGEVYRKFTDSLD